MRGDRHNLAQQRAWRWLVLLAVPCLAACDRATDPATTRPADADDAAAATRPFVLSGKSPFTGTIRAKKLAGPVTLADVTYTIDVGRIRRDEVDHGDVVTERLAGIEPRSGVIVDPSAGRVVLYATYLERRHYVTLTPAEYDRHLEAELASKAGASLRPHGYGTTFLPLGAVERYSATNDADATTVNGLTCDRLVLHPPRCRPRWSTAGRSWSTARSSRASSPGCPRR